MFLDRETRIGSRAASAGVGDNRCPKRPKQALRAPIYDQPVAKSNGRTPVMATLVKLFHRSRGGGNRPGNNERLLLSPGGNLWRLGRPHSCLFGRHLADRICRSDAGRNGAGRSQLYPRHGAGPGDQRQGSRLRSHIILRRAQLYRGVTLAPSLTMPWALDELEVTSSPAVLRATAEIVHRQSFPRGPRGTGGSNDITLCEPRQGKTLYAEPSAHYRRSVVYAAWR